jgi:MFS family permease
MKKNSNIFLARILSLYRFSSNAIFYAPIVVLYFKDAFENELKSYILISAYTLTITIFEIPSGIFADVKGNYKALILGLFLSAGGTALLIVNSNFLIVLFGQILVGIGLSLKSGAESALIR